MPTFYFSLYGGGLDPVPKKQASKRTTKDKRSFIGESEIFPQWLVDAHRLAYVTGEIIQDPLILKTHHSEGHGGQTKHFVLIDGEKVRVIRIGALRSAKKTKKSSLGSGIFKAPANYYYSLYGGGFDPVPHELLKEREQRGNKHFIGDIEIFPQSIVDLYQLHYVTGEAVRDPLILKTHFSQGKRGWKKHWVMHGEQMVPVFTSNASRLAKKGGRSLMDCVVQEPLAPINFYYSLYGGGFDPVPAEKAAERRWEGSRSFIGDVEIFREGRVNACRLHYRTGEAVNDPIVLQTLRSEGGGRWIKHFAIKDEEEVQLFTLPALAGMSEEGASENKKKRILPDYPAGISVPKKPIQQAAFSTLFSNALDESLNDDNGVDLLLSLRG